MQKLYYKLLLSNMIPLLLLILIKYYDNRLIIIFNYELSGLLNYLLFDIYID